MPRPKGSKNKAPRKTAIPTTDFDTLIAEKSSSKEALVADIATLEENLDSIKTELKAKKAELKKLDTELGKLEEQKAEIVKFIIKPCGKYQSLFIKYRTHGFWWEYPYSL